MHHGVIRSNKKLIVVYFQDKLLIMWKTERSEGRLNKPEQVGMNQNNPKQSGAI